MSTFLRDLVRAFEEAQHRRIFVDFGGEFAAERARDGVMVGDDPIAEASYDPVSMTPEATEDVERERENHLDVTRRAAAYRAYVDRLRAVYRAAGDDEARDNELDRAYLDEREHELDVRMNRLDEREHELDVRMNRLDEREAQVAARETGLQAWADNLWELQEDLAQERELDDLKRDAVVEDHKVARSLRDLGDLFAQRHAMYGDNYKRIGGVLRALFPDGPVVLETVSDFLRMAMFVQIVLKISRYGSMFAEGGHRDSLDDNSVYSQMLAEVDEFLDEA